MKDILLARGVHEDFGSFFIHSFTFLICEKFMCKCHYVYFVFYLLKV